jgi:hypothetical protein
MTARIRCPIKSASRVPKTEMAAHSQATRDAISYSAVYPSGSQDVIRMDGLFGQDILDDPRGDTDTSRPIATLDTLVDDPDTNGGDAFTLSAGSVGFWGLGIYQVGHRPGTREGELDSHPRPADNSPSSILCCSKTMPVGRAPNSRTPSASTSPRTPGRPGRKRASCIGEESPPARTKETCEPVTPCVTKSVEISNWIEADQTKAGSWAVPVDRIRVGSTVVDTAVSYVSSEAASHVADLRGPLIRVTMRSMYRPELLRASSARFQMLKEIEQMLPAGYAVLLPVTVLTFRMSRATSTYP